MRLTPPTVLFAAASFVAMAATAIGLTLVMSRTDSSDPAQRYDRLTAPECAGFGIADFAGADSLEQLLSKTGTVIKGRVADRYIASGTHQRNLGYDIEVKKVLAGEVADSTVTLAFNFAEVCLAPGEYEYYFFMARTEGPRPGSAHHQQPRAVHTALVRPAERVSHRVRPHRQRLRLRPGAVRRGNGALVRGRSAGSSVTSGVKLTFPLPLRRGKIT